MFFAETLGPILSYQTAVALAKYVKARHTGPGGLPLDQLLLMAGEFLRQNNIRATPEAAVALLAQHGLVAAEDAGTGFNVAA